MRLRRLPLAAIFAAALAGACTAEVEEKGSAPDVDVDPGSMPRVDVDPARVDVGTDTQTVVTPDVDIVPTQGDDKDK